MRFANVADRLKLLVDDGAIDVHNASGGRFPAEPQAAYHSWDDLRKWARTATESGSGRVEQFDPAEAGPPAPQPGQVFAVGLNYADHAKETGREAPTAPVIFTKYISAFSGPVSTVTLPAGGHTDWETELVAVVSRSGYQVPAADGWSYIAGVTVGQDLSERVLQRSGPAPQFGLAKSHPGFAPMGPALVTPDELADPDDLAIGCEINGERMQSARTSDMLFSVPELVAYLSTIVVLSPGDLIYTGTPPGVGVGRTPPRFLHPGDRLHSWIEGVGELNQTFVSPPV